MQSLRDKLLKAGLVSEDAAKKAEADKKSRPPPASARPPPPQERRHEAPSSKVPKFAPLPGSKEAHRLQAKKQLEQSRALRETVLAAQVPPEAGATPFYFVTRKNKLRRLELSEAQAKRLETGELAVVERPDPDKIEHALVPVDVARALLVDHPKAVRFLNAPGAAVGFLSEQEISSRSHETTEAEEASAEAPSEASDAPAPAPASAGGDATWITIKRSPKAE